MKRVIASVLAVLLTLLSGVAALTAAANPNARAVQSIISAEEGAADYILPYQEAAEEKLLTLELISDTHIGKDGASEIVRSCIGRMDTEKNGIDGIIVSGDLTNNGTLPQMDEFYGILQTYTGDRIITANGNHDYGLFSPTWEHRPIALRARNDYLNLTTEKDYYSTEIKGYKVIVLGTEGEKVNSAVVTEEQLNFLRREAAEGGKDGKPFFVVCHWPLRNTHGERISWPILPGGALETATTRQVLNILSQYDNAVYISGHLHAGLNGRLTKRLFNACCVEQHNGVTCINVPGCGKSNHFGLPTKGTGMHLTVYADRIVVEGRNYVTGEWYDQYVYEAPMRTYHPAAMPEPDAVPASESAPLQAETPLTALPEPAAADPETLQKADVAPAA